MPEKAKGHAKPQWPASLDFEWSQAKQDEFRAVFGANPAVLNNLLAFCGVLAPNRANEAHESGRNEGRREVGLYLVHMMNFAPITLDFSKGVL